MTKSELHKAIEARMKWRIEQHDTTTNEGILEAVWYSFVSEIARLEKRIEELEAENASV